MTFDSHNHLQSDQSYDSLRDLIVGMLEDGITGCVTNGTCPTDWPKVADLSAGYPQFVTPAYGVHPWQLGGLEPGWSETLCRYLADNRTASVGEIGLDGSIEGGISAQQSSVFEDQLVIAIELKRPVTIHCVKAWGSLFDSIKRVGNLPEKTLFHSFSGSIEIAQRLTKMGSYFSFSEVNFRGGISRVSAKVQKIPLNRILIETDAPRVNIIQKAHGMSASEVVATEIPQLFRIASRMNAIFGHNVSSKIYENSRHFWGVGIKPKIETEIGDLALHIL